MPAVGSTGGRGPTAICLGGEAKSFLAARKSMFGGKCHNLGEYDVLHAIVSAVMWVARVAPILIEPWTPLAL